MSTKHNLCKTLGLIILVMMSMSVSAYVKAEDFGFNIESVNLMVYRDGLVHVTQIMRVNETISQITLPLLSASIENILVVDENETVLDYEINDSNITIFTLGATNVTLEYDTVAITSLDSGVWTLSFKGPYNLTVMLPEDADVIFLSNVPNSIDTEGNRITLSIFPGEWEISYILPVLPLKDFEVTNLKVSPLKVKSGEEVTISVLVTNVGRESGSYDVVLKVNGSVEDVKTVTLNGGESTEVKFRISKKAAGIYSVEVAGLKEEFRVEEAVSTGAPTEYTLPLVVISVAAASLVLIILFRRKRKPNITEILENHPYLRQEERDVLAFLIENNGKAFESEIRRRFPDIPRTSLWRLIRRLEREEIVRIRKVGPGNLVELNK
ncbi:hypothetical protein CW705_00710 [Candidatus Bathyarchaeota archaeon]|nr:MAG: hypothetical protein CW705_00710 [Candidatus Bathyarchaeota archaeon]